jgi:hypothetical protein
VADEVVVHELDDAKAAVPLPEQLWHVPVRVDAESQMPGDWQGSVSEWVLAQVRAHVASIAVAADQFESLMVGDAHAAAAAVPASAEAFVVAAAFAGPEPVDAILLPAHASLDLHGLVQPFIA